jgi:hypothetical protein
VGGGDRGQHRAADPGVFFGDGGVLAYPANAFSMAFVMPMLGYGVSASPPGAAR